MSFKIEKNGNYCLSTRHISFYHIYELKEQEENDGAVELYVSMKTIY